MKVILLIVSFLFGMQTICLSQNNLDEKQLRLYQEILGLYPSELISGYPDALTDKKVVLTDFAFPRGRCLSHIHLGLSFDNDKIDSLKNEFAMNAKDIYHFTDSCLMSIPYDYSELKVVSLDSVRICKDSHALPIPNFKRWRLTFTDDFYKDALIYVLDAKKGSFLKEEVLSESGVGLPEEWTHGYTKGVTIFKNYVIYWLEVW